jgi:hypothetical protein
MLAGSRNRFVETGTGYGCKALDAEETRQIARGIYLVQ